MLVASVVNGAASTTLSVLSSFHDEIYETTRYNDRF